VTRLAFGRARRGRSRKLAESHPRGEPHARGNVETTDFI
jgi:hypothetical protein